MPKYNYERRYEDTKTWEEVKCPYCNKLDISKYGLRKNKYSIIPKQKFKCRNCRRTFTPHDFSFGRKYSEEKIIETLELYYKLKSFNKVSKQLEIPIQTIKNWDKEFKVLDGRLMSYEDYEWRKTIKDWEKLYRTVIEEDDEDDDEPVDFEQVK